jgi:hypothetical protein
MRRYRVRKLAGFRYKNWQDAVWRHPHLFNNEAMEVYRTVINYNETAEEEVQDTYCQGSGGVPQRVMSSKIGGYRGFIESISAVSVIIRLVIYM